MRWTSCGTKRLREAVLGREAEGFVGHNDPHAGNFGLAAFLRVRGVRHRRERTDGHLYVHGTEPMPWSRFQDFIAFDRPVISLRTPVSEKILLRVARPGFPKLVSEVGVVGNQRMEETVGSFFFGVVTEYEVKHDHGGHNYRRDRERYGS